MEPNLHVFWRARCARMLSSAVPILLLGVMLVDRAAAQTFGLDDLPAAPIIGPAGFGLGAEDPYALVGPPLAPSPSLGIIGALGDGAWLSPGPVLQHPGPNGFYVDSFSTHHVDDGSLVALDFSVDRVTRGVAASAVGAEAAAGQAHGDIYTGTHVYLSPGLFVGLPPLPPVFLPSIAGGGPGNVLTTDESVFGLLTSAGIVGPGVVVPPPITSPGLHDNLESFDNIPSFDANGDGLFDVDAYFTLYPDEALPLGLSPADIFAVAAGDGGALAVPYAPFFLMGLDAVEDSIDALVMYDNNLKPIPQGPNSPAPGIVEPGIDYALFSLAPGSLSLQLFGLDAADIFFTDFTGTFAVYAPSASLGLQTTPPGFPFQGESVDALDAVRAGVPPIIIQDGRCVYELNNTVGQRLTDMGGFANLITGNTDHVFQNWFWYRASGDSREYALSNRIFASSATNHARLIYSEPLFDGALPDALLFDLEYTISELSTFAVAGAPFGAAPPACARCELVIAIKVRNLNDDTVVTLFSYNDMDLNGTAGSDSAVIAGVDNQVQLIRDRGPGGTGCIASGIYKVSSDDHVAWEIGPFASIRNRLADGVPDVLANAASPFGPADYSGAQQWDFTLGPVGSPALPPFDEWVGSVVKEVSVHSPGDIDGDCDVDLDDLTLLLQNFGVVCVP